MPVLSSACTACIDLQFHAALLPGCETQCGEPYKQATDQSGVHVCLGTLLADTDSGKKLVIGNNPPYGTGGLLCQRFMTYVASLGPRVKHWLVPANVLQYIPGYTCVYEQKFTQ